MMTIGIPKSNTNNQFMIKNAGELVTVTDSKNDSVTAYVKEVQWNSILPYTYEVTLTLKYYITTT